MTVAMDLPFNVMMGMDYSLRLYEKTGRSDGLLVSRPYKLAVLSSLPITGAVAWIYTKAPDWMLSYYTDHRKIPKAMQILLFCSYPVMFTMGFTMAPQLEQVRKGLTKKVIAAIMVYETLFMLLGWKRFSHICTTEEFESGRSKLSIWHTNHLRWALVGLMIAVHQAYFQQELKKLKSD